MNMGNGDVMKYLKYVLVIIVIGLVVFIGVELFRSKDAENQDNTNTTDNRIENTNTTNNNETGNTTGNTSTDDNTGNQNEIQNGEQLLEQADKTLTARGWAGASNNVIGLKDNILYFYNKESGEFKKIATGIEDIYYNTDDPEEMIAKKGTNAEILDNEQTFLIYE